MPEPTKGHSGASLPGLHTVEMTFRPTDAKRDFVERFGRDLARIGWRLRATHSFDSHTPPLVTITLEGPHDAIPVTLIRTAVRQLEVLHDA